MMVRFSNGEMGRRRCTGDYLSHQESLSYPNSPILHYLSLSLSCFTLSYFIFSLWNLAHVSHQQQVIINLPCPIQRLSVPLSICLFFSYFILSHFIFSHFIIVKPGLSAASRSGTSPRSTCSPAGKPSQKGRRLSIRF